MEAELLAAIYAAPDDDAPRLVYADWLQDRGDSYGELIALQLQGVTGPRVDALLQEHEARAIGSLASQVRWAKLERGFPASCEAKPGADPRDPCWATVHHVWGVELLADDAPLPWLRRLDARDLHIAALRRLARPLAIETLVWHMDDDLPQTGALARLAILPALRRLEISDERRFLPLLERRWAHPDELGWLGAAPILGHLHQLALRIDVSQLAAWLVRFTPTSIQRLELADPGVDPWRVLVARDAAGGLGELAIHLPATPPPPAAFNRFGDAMVAGLLSLSRSQLSSARIVGATEATVDTVARLERRLQTQTRVRKIVIE